LRLILSIILSLAPYLCYSQAYFLVSKAQKTYLEYVSLRKEINPHYLSQAYSNEGLSSLLSNDSTMYARSIGRFCAPAKKFLSVGGTARARVGKDDIDPNHGIMGNLYGIFSSGNLSAVLNYRADSDYHSDTKYFGSVGKFESEVIGRITDSYLQYDNSSVTLFYGRQERNFGIINIPSLILSDVPHSFDHFFFAYNSKVFTFSYLTTRLEDKVSYDIRDELQQSDWHKRYFSFHRVDLSLSKKLQFGFSESILYGGTNQSYLSQYTNPLNVWFVSKMVERKGVEEANANVLMSLDVIYKPSVNIVLYSQFLIDDMDFTKATRARYPDRIGYIGKFIWLDPLPKSMLSMEYVHISNWTYNSYYTFGNYTFYGESIGYPKNGYKMIKIKYDTFNFENMLVSASLFAHAERDQDLESPFIDTKSKLPIGTVKSSVGFSLELNYQISSWSAISFKTQFLNYSNYENVQGLDKSILNYHLSMDFTL
jgi:hypothetical protein